MTSWWKLSTCYLVSHFYADYKKNFLALEQLVLIGGPDDGVMTPWQSRFDTTLPSMPLVKCRVRGQELMNV